MGILSIATVPIQQGHLTENPILITAVHGCYEGKMFVLMLISPFNKLPHQWGQNTEKIKAPRLRQSQVAPAI